MLKSCIWTTAMLIPAIVACQGSAQTIYTNGPLSTGPTSGSGVAAPAGTNWSECSDDGTLLCANTNAGYSCANAGAAIMARLADDFTVPNGQTWNVTSVSVAAYQTGTVGNPFSAATLQIWNGRPGDVGSTVVFGDTTTNRMASSTFGNVYRVFNTTTPAPGTAPGTTRQVHEVVLTAVVSLPAGTYWIDFDTTATNTLNHFAPVTTIENNRQAATSPNGRQSVNGLWQDMVDLGNPATCADVLQECVFKVNGSVTGGGGCFPNCDQSTGTPLLTGNDFVCFINAFAGNQSYANCDQSTGVPLLTGNDFVCFINAYAQGCT